MRRDLRFDRLSPELQEKLTGRYTVTALSMAMGLPPKDAIADQNAHLNELSRRDSLSLEEVTHLRAKAGGWTEDHAQGWADGFAEGRATAVLRVLQGRGIHVTGTTWERVTSCSDLATLTHWLKRSMTVDRAADLFIEERDAREGRK
ncbi:hypothetical protein [Streptomyces sp. V3I7]|uniref:hypothetical protein n=1 Tax=Streptomyces sp. V3I7 TaxID=3042278 RepID=UPI002785A253|nr:hypothetical protein [Streptomyces sp. V3I7]MDQ0991957.1 hypothetical protein [Streptomyces sp. V3I7]